MPVVLEGHPGRWLLPDDLASRCDQVDIDNCGAIRRAMEYLCGLGHTRLAYLSSSPRAQSERVAAFEEFARECGFAAGNAWVLTDLADSREGGGEGLRRLLEARPEERPTAVICTGSDRIALGLVAAARGRGLRCPEDLSVINFGDNRLSDDPRNLAELTSLEFSQEDMANTLMSLLQEQMAGARRSARQVRTPMELIVRQSCAPANAASRPAAG
jgi:DNA-binding LacI/PurR family transcriptional regulator